MRRWVATIGAAAVCAGVTTGEETAPAPGLAGARQAALRFLTAGPAAPRPHLGPEALAAAPARRLDLALPPRGGPALELVLEGCTVLLDGRGHVVGYTASDRDLPAGPRRLAGRGWLLGRAEAFLDHAVPDRARRRFVRYREELQAEHEPVELLVAWEERPGPGALACYPNRALVWLNPATGEVVRYLATDVRAEVREAPPVTGAEALARAGRGGAARLEGLSVVLQRGELRPVWVVEVAGDGAAPFALVCARTGELLEAREW